MCFATVLDHLETILVHFQQNLKIDFFRDFDHFGPFWPFLGPFWALFGPLLGPKRASGAQKVRGEPAKMCQKRAQTLRLFKTKVPGARSGGASHLIG